MLSVEEQNIVDILEDSELDFKWKKSSLSNSLFIHVDMTIGNNLSNDLMKKVWESPFLDNREKITKSLNKEPLMVRIKKLTGHILEECKVKMRVKTEMYMENSKRVGIILVFSKENTIVRKIRE